MDNRVEAVPRFQAAMEVGYRVPAVPGLRVAAGLKHVGKQALSNTNGWALKAVTLFDLGAVYRMRISGSDFTLRAGITNLANKKYWATESWGGLRAGEPRTFAVNAQWSLATPRG